MGAGVPMQEKLDCGAEKGLRWVMGGCYERVA